jgi:hypothetical protein
MASQLRTLFGAISQQGTCACVTHSKCPACNHEQGRPDSTTNTGTNQPCPGACSQAVSADLPSPTITLPSHDLALVSAARIDSVGIQFAFCQKLQLHHLFNPPPPPTLLGLSCCFII